MSYNTLDDQIRDNRNDGAKFLYRIEKILDTTHLLENKSNLSSLIVLT